jgi:hypothetical protein
MSYAYHFCSTIELPVVQRKIYSINELVEAGRTVEEVRADLSGNFGIVLEDFDWDEPIMMIMDLNENGIECDAKLYVNDSLYYSVESNYPYQYSIENPEEDLIVDYLRNLDEKHVLEMRMSWLGSNADEELEIQEVQYVELTPSLLSTYFAPGFGGTKILKISP